MVKQTWLKGIALVVMTAMALAGCSKTGAQTRGSGGGGSAEVQAEAPDGFVWIEGGTFTMGSPANEPGRDDDEGPQHQVTVSSFYMGKYEVTQKEYQEIMGTNPSYWKGDNLPVECVDWYDAIEYCNRRSEMEGLTPAYTIDKNQKDPNNTYRDDTVKWMVTWNRNANGYRLPTEAEWEYAAKGGNGSPGNYTYAGSNTVGDVAWYGSNSGERTHEVGKKKANGLGLYDMSGNVREWCWDWFGDYSGSAQTDPTGPVSGTYRVVRGGGWIPPAEYVRSACRYQGAQNYGNSVTGFRLVRP